ncbi:MAG: hypothetical protein AAGD35_19075 [Actinomycetota bacterium]
MRVRSDHLTLAALAALASLVTHQLAYLAVYPVEATRVAKLADHGHLGTQWALVTPVAVVAASWFILRQIGDLGIGRGLSGRRLGGAATALFALQETLETTARGEAVWAVFTHPAIVLGLVLAPVVGWAFARMLGVVETAVRRLRSPAPTATFDRRRPTVHRPSSDRRPTILFLSSAPTRGPPVVRC